MWHCVAFALAHCSPRPLYTMSKLDLELIPGQRLGPFALGTSLWSVLESLRQQQTAYPHISVSFDSSEPANSPILIHLRPYFDLLFTSSQQRLHTISVRLVDAEPPLSLQYKATQLLSSELPLRRVDVSRVFGPTYAGPTMKYPGIWFGFEEDPKSLPKRQGVEDKTQEVKRIVLSQHTDDQPAAVDPMDRITPCEAMEGDIIRVTAKLHSGISMRFHSNNSHRPDIQVLLQKTTAQDLLASIGPPLRVHYKDDDRLAIHGSAKSGSQQSCQFWSLLQTPALDLDWQIFTTIFNTVSISCCLATHTVCRRSLSTLIL
jgi:hypothetical protein